MSTNQDNKPISHWRMELNNIVQKNKALGEVKWDKDYSPHGHQGPWTAVVRINGVEYGTGQGSSKDAAREVAAKMAYEEVVRRLRGE
ncbi:hypothetical protein DAEQUDRAFT_769571 [Daedalea quercina L-15889]|uniref:DRBM domain-containing protein n=1 Tax=Daedalea quercina L-15889 TaxID=1314783 RepID=A0A165LLL6_9APHY|nr:hypothetical protein DAEQUDRAFT_769571 [Daedalea quercina L-15889]